MKKKDIYVMLLIFLIAFIPRAVCSALMLPFNVPNDEISNLATPAYLAGLDWSNVVAGLGQYYGFGYTMIFTPIFKLTDNAIIIYRVVLLTSSFVYSVTAPIAYYVMSKYTKVDNAAYKAMAALICSFFCGTQGPIYMNEAPLYLVIWLAALVIMKLMTVTNRKLRVIYSVVLQVLLAYSITLHTRAVILYIAFVAWIIYTIVMYKKVFINIIASLVVGAALYILAKNIIGQVQTDVWMSGAEGLVNATVNVGSSLFERLKNVHFWEAFYVIVLGLLNTVLLFSGGSAVFCALEPLKVFCKRVKCRFEKRETEVSQQEAIFIYSLVAALVAVAGIAVLWNSDVVTGLKEGYGSEAYGLKAVTYLRYFSSFFGPGMLVGFAALYEKLNKKERYANTIFLIIILQILWMHSALPYIQNHYHAHFGFMSLSFGYYTSEVTCWTYLAASIWLLAIGILVYILYRKKKISLILLPVCCFIIYENIYLYGVMVKAAPEKYSVADAGLELVEGLEDAQIEVDKIYALTSKEMYQMLINRYTIYIEQPETAEENSIIFVKSNYESTKLETMGYEKHVLDDNEAVYYYGDDIRKYIVTVHR